MTFDGLEPALLARLLGVPRLEVRATVTSTLDVAHELAQAGSPSGTLVLAEEQTEGRGRQGRRWVSPPGGGVWLTMLLTPPAMPTIGVLALRAGLAAAEALSEAARELAPRLKWPNDVVVAGRKAGGILCEARWSADAPLWVAVGVGLNVAGPVPVELRGTAIALADIAPAISRLSILSALVPRLRALEALPPTLSGAEQARFLERAWWPAGDGTVAGLAPDGALLLEHSDGTLRRRTDAA